MVTRSPAGSLGAKEIPWSAIQYFLPRQRQKSKSIIIFQYARPLIEGKVKIPSEGGLPKFAVLEKKWLEQKLAKRV